MVEGMPAGLGSSKRTTRRARQAYADASYCLFQGLEFSGASDAVIRTSLVPAHARLFQGAIIKLPQGIDLQVYVAGQTSYSEHLERTCN
jgi:hypothetical protein